MAFFFFTLDEHIINVYFYVTPNLLIEHLIYQSLVCSSCVLQTKRHNPITVESLAGDEGCFFLIFLGHLYLVVPRKCVNEGKELVPGG